MAREPGLKPHLTEPPGVVSSCCDGSSTTTPSAARVLIHPIAAFEHPPVSSRSLLEILPNYQRSTTLLDHHFAIFCFFFGRSAICSSAGPSLSPPASAISSSLSLPLLSWFSSNSSPTSDSDSVLKSSSTLSSSSSALPRLATSPSLEARSSSCSAAARMAPD